MSSSTVKIRQALHNNVERKRRARVNVLIDRLGELLPPTLRMSTSNRTKCLEVVHAYIVELKTKFDALMFANPQNVYVQEILSLKRQLSQLDKVLANSKLLLKKVGVSDRLLTSDDPNLQEAIKRLDGGRKRTSSGSSSSSDSSDQEETEESANKSAPIAQSMPMFVNPQPPTTFLLINNQLVATQSAGLFNQQLTTSNFVASQASSTVASNQPANRNKKKKKKVKTDKKESPRTLTENGELESQKTMLTTTIEKINPAVDVNKSVDAEEAEARKATTTDNKTPTNELNEKETKQEETKASAADFAKTKTTVTTPSKSCKSSYSAESLLQPKNIELPTSPARLSANDSDENRVNKTIEAMETNDSQAREASPAYNLQNFSHLMKPLTGGVGEDSGEEGGSANNAAATNSVVQYFNFDSANETPASTTTSSTPVTYGSQFLATAGFDPTVFAATPHRCFNANFMPDFNNSSFSLAGAAVGGGGGDSSMDETITITSLGSKMPRVTMPSTSKTVTSTCRTTSKSKSTTITTNSSKKSTPVLSTSNRKKKETSDPKIVPSSNFRSNEVDFSTRASNTRSSNRTLLENSNNNSFLMNDIISPSPMTSSVGNNIPSSYSTFSTFAPPPSSTPTTSSSLSHPHHHYHSSGPNMSSHFGSTNEPASFSAASHYQTRYQNLFTEPASSGQSNGNTGNAHVSSYQTPQATSNNNASSNRSYEFDHFLSGGETSASSSSNAHQPHHHHHQTPSLLSSFIPPPPTSSVASNPELANYPLFRPQPQAFPTPAAFEQTNRAQQSTTTSSSHGSSSSTTISTRNYSSALYSNLAVAASSGSVPNFNLSNILDISQSGGGVLAEQNSAGGQPAKSSSSRTSYHNIARSEASSSGAHDGSCFLPKLSKFPSPSMEGSARNFYHQPASSNQAGSMPSSSSSNTNYPAHHTGSGHYGASPHHHHHAHYFPYSQSPMDFMATSSTGTTASSMRSNVNAANTARTARSGSEVPGSSSFCCDEPPLMPAPPNISFGYPSASADANASNSSGGHYGSNPQGPGAGFHQSNFHRSGPGGQTLSSSAAASTPGAPPPLAPLSILGRFNFN